ncbi:tagaturonate epimerase family protein [Paenibacillus aurantius]|uniref:Tagaturonate/fructuronate epimerase n=1 Tax=Paenibacillus aurantius TaxID=2918900 RepID=A0AA96LL45_9BACL|nr:tagaturonate epimerase family protein [Paenibacillus aurantius]WNQ13382.1 tagaturonate epimerase family protein [Paenibacillus aurantius]
MDIQTGHKESALSIPGLGPEDRIYPRSYNETGGTRLVMVKKDHTKYLVAAGSGPLFEDLQGNVKEEFKWCPLTHENRLVLNRYFEYTAPQAFGTQIATFGLGDRLGLASPGHLETIRGRDVRPILAQQSIRELNLTGRDYKEVLDAACFAAFQEGYKDGFGADGDHLKVEPDIEMALRLGFTMLTLDCSEKIDNTVEKASAEEREEKYSQLPEELRRHYEERYLDQSFSIGDTSIRFDRDTLIRNVLIYSAAIDFMETIYNTYIQKAERPVDFEISIDETETPTDPASHYLVAKELYSRGVEIFSMAPRFCGEFQKGIDYIGDIGQFEQELALHARIADDFGYKLSIHSGSDKFSVFPIIAKYTKGRFHVKTAGTNWLEAVRTVAQVNPSLYRRMHAFALEHFHEAAAYYHVTTDLSKIVPLNEVSDEALADTYMNEDNARQLLHITYGLLLQAKDGEGKFLFKDEFYRTLSEHEDDYKRSLIGHIGKHLDLLGK